MKCNVNYNLKFKMHYKHGVLTFLIGNYQNTNPAKTLKLKLLALTGKIKHKV